MIDALVFAAGRGTRLRPLTDRTPKALVTVGGMTILERSIRRIWRLSPGVVVVNAHHHAEQIEAEVDRLNRRFAIEAERHPAQGASRRTVPKIVVSFEPDRPLETGGGLRQARGLFEAGRPVLLHNGDVITDLELEELVSWHAERSDDGRTVATLAVQRRDSTRQLLFDASGLYGRRHVTSGREEISRPPVGKTRALAFAGIHIVAPELLASLPEREVFSITDFYLELAASGAGIQPFDMQAAAWWEVGTPERLAAVRREFEGT